MLRTVTVVGQDTKTRGGQNSILLGKADNALNKFNDIISNPKSWEYIYMTGLRHPPGSLLVKQAAGYVSKAKTNQSVSRLYDTLNTVIWSPSGELTQSTFKYFIPTKPSNNGN